MARLPTVAGQYVYKQEAASATWNITHKLGKYPSVTVQDSANNEIEGDIVYTSTSAVQLKFSAAFTGTAYLN